MEEDKLQMVFKDIKDTFFPYWDKAGNWKIVWKDLYKACKCVSELKEIHINRILETAPYIDLYAAKNEIFKGTQDYSPVEKYKI